MTDIYEVVKPADPGLIVIHANGIRYTFPHATFKVVATINPGSDNMHPSGAISFGPPTIDHLELHLHAGYEMKEFAMLSEIDVDECPFDCDNCRADPELETE